MSDPSTERDTPGVLWHRNEDELKGTTNGVHPGTYGATLGGVRGKTMYVCSLCPLSLPPLSPLAVSLSFSRTKVGKLMKTIRDAWV